MPANLETRNGTLYWRQTIGGQLHRRSTGYPASGGRRAVELALRKARQFELEVREGKDGFAKKDVPYFGAWASRFLNAYYPGKYTEDVLLRRPITRWAGTKLDAVTRSDIETFFRERQAADAKGGTLERERILLKRLFRAAVDDGLIAKNPMLGLKAFKTTPRTRVMTRDEEAHLREVLSPSWNRFLTVALTTGLRLSELLGLRPCDVFERDGQHWLRVRPETNKTKTGREVPLRAETVDALTAQAIGLREPSWCYWPLTRQSAWVTLKRACKSRGITPTISVHDLRRTFGTRAAEGGMLLSHLQKIMGHKSPLVTAKYYVHLEQKSIADALNEVTL